MRTHLFSEEHHGDLKGGVGVTGPTTERMEMRSCHGPQGPTFFPSRSICWSLCPLQIPRTWDPALPSSPHRPQQWLARQ